MRPTTITVGPLAAASANNIALSQTPTGAVTLNGSTVVGGVAILDQPRRVLVTTAGNETGKTITITGTDWNSNTVSETVAAPNVGTVATNVDFRTVTAITISAAAAGAITVGTNGVASSRWMTLDSFAPAQVSLQCTVTGTVNYTVQQTLQSPNDVTNLVAPASVVWVNSNDANVVNTALTAQSNYAYAPVMVKVTLNSGAGTVSMVVQQLSAVPY